MAQFRITPSSNPVSAITSLYTPRFTQIRYRNTLICAKIPIIRAIAERYRTFTGSSPQHDTAVRNTVTMPARIGRLSKTESAAVRRKEEKRKSLYVQHNRKSRNTWLLINRGWINCAYRYTYPTRTKAGVESIITIQTEKYIKRQILHRNAASKRHTRTLVIALKE